MHCITATYIIGPYFYDGTGSGVTCIKCGIMLYQSQTTMGLCNRCHFSKIVFQRISPWLCEFLNESLTGQCNGWGCATSPSPLLWWPWHPSLSTPDNSLCTNAALWVIITDTCISSTPWIQCRRSQRMWWCIKLCEVHEGSHRDLLDPYSAGKMKYISQVYSVFLDIL